MSPYAATLAQARLDALHTLIDAMNAADTPAEQRRCAVAILRAPEPTDIDDEIDDSADPSDSDDTDDEDRHEGEPPPQDESPDPDESPAPPQPPPSPATAHTHPLNVLSALAPLELPRPHSAPHSPAQRLLARAEHPP